MRKLLGTTRIYRLVGKLKYDDCTLLVNTKDELESSYAGDINV